MIVNRRRERRRFHVRNRVRGTAERPRLSVHRSLRQISCQVIDDIAGKTLVSVSTLDKDMRDRVAAGGNRAAAAIVGKAIAEKALQAGIKEVRFDRGPCKYHGRVASLADAAREAGLVF
ncbi:MAG: 50S ribosomal protein L18 [Pirellulaceae bacterium]|jgi:large subunit ribosomal protein L18|nr:50S ribosomal protein L18 [Pirellulaceae bacterium]MCU0977567.1 50S ribosomal protein L18 [Pirellulaceae bacterium]